ADRVFGLAFGPEGDLLAVAGWDGSVRVWKREFVVGAAVQPEPEPKPSTQPAAERHLSLRGVPENSDELEFMGPRARACVRSEPEGLRLTVPVGFNGERPNTGVRIPMPATGDFEATVNYEILAEPEPADVVKIPTKLAMLVRFERPAWTMAVITRRVAPEKGRQHTAWTVRDHVEGTGKKRMRYREFPAEGNSGRLRIARHGEDISFSIAEGAGAEFTLL